MAYDLACPVECRANERVFINEDSEAECPVCHSRYDVFEKLGHPISGPALDDGYGLQVYRVGPGAQGEYMIVSKSFHLPLLQSQITYLMKSYIGLWLILAIGLVVTLALSAFSPVTIGGYELRDSGAYAALTTPRAAATEASADDALHITDEAPVAEQTPAPVPALAVSIPFNPEIK